ncbi:MAG TPA: acetyl/propionyl/methylcrotonyl-CoA carboxylase subunit alpha [Pedomonas sp.]|uniref:acetyl/propionyl/methylcrotonyl-CoA carboxylase subunit alpha n=1 Tax=Pedomonas sp. TaxID=2976421 RepID=UPI002F41F5E9
MRRILIANRGEIARRVIRTARRMGIETVAIYSDADAQAPHVVEATMAVHIGPAPATESYLQVERIIDAALKSGADAIHPGYGFLSENAGFAERCQQAGLIFIGPGAEAIRAMGLKDGAKRLMRQAGVPIVPGYQGDDQSLDRLQRSANAIGYPILIKAVAGGGGKGMRRVGDADSFADALLAAKREAARAFGNDSVLIEKYLTQPRHVEVQVFADTHGNVVHLFERDCSLQRRHQKVVEEAPAPGLPEEMRKAMGEAAVTAAKAIGYVGAGTVEFILDVSEGIGKAPFYFMEMNTRLQVEHPVTELITGYDLVEWQIRVARGETLPAAQEDIRINGHAVEVRLYAEDVEAGFLPSTGRLEQLSLPDGLTGVRVDSGVEQGQEITVHYDPMIAKVISHGVDRSVAIDRLINALDATIAVGPKTNRSFLARLIGHPAFRAEEIDTGFIERHLEDLAPISDVPDRLLALAALAAATPRARPDTSSPWSALGPWRLNLPYRQSIDLFLPNGIKRTLDLITRPDGSITISGLDEDLSGIPNWRGEHRFEVDFSGSPARAIVLHHGHSLEVRVGGYTFHFGLRDREEGDKGAFPRDGKLTAPMPGKVLGIFVKPGQSVEAGERLLVLEAMKMEHRLAAPVAGTIKAVHIGENDQVPEGRLLIELETVAEA